MNLFDQFLVFLGVRKVLNAYIQITLCGATEVAKANAAKVTKEEDMRRLERLINGKEKNKS